MTRLRGHGSKQRQKRALVPADSLGSVLSLTGRTAREPSVASAVVTSDGASREELRNSRMIEQSDSRDSVEIINADGEPEPVTTNRLRRQSMAMIFRIQEPTVVSDVSVPGSSTSGHPPTPSAELHTPPDSKIFEARSAGHSLETSGRRESQCIEADDLRRTIRSSPEQIGTPF